jgi:hypothetical protein
MDLARNAIAGLLVLLSVTPAYAQTLKGSPTAMNRQHNVARQHDYTFLRTTSDVRRFIGLGLIEKLSGDANYALANVSFPYARPAVRTFVERLAGQYHAACGEKLVVTSLTRPESRQPRNASDLSVHPAGMAVDLRVSRKASCRSWLERTLLSLERSGVLDATRERFPAHYHIAIFPDSYLAYVDQLTSRGTRVAAAAGSSGGAVVADAASGPNAESDVVLANLVEYRVDRGDTLWAIARRHGTTVDELKAMNSLSSSRIKAGQVLSVPTGAQQ